ncbi:probable glutamate receptor [Periplaneta americana]|uniref:probable glutamate receptor n=1 Tax=Periplaneta americana TaxID=6978 RepID=UPI0037E8C9F9
MFKTRRLDVLDYAGEVGAYEGAFLFLKPSLSEISNIYTLPFSRAVWLAYFVIMIIFTLAMYISQNAEDRLLNSKQAEPVTMVESIFTSIAVICQEGTSRDPRNVSSRIIFLSLLMLSLFVTTSYSAIIVSLLQTTSSQIQTLKDLLDSQFKLSMKDFVANRRFINDTTDRVVKTLYNKHLFTQPDNEAFTSTEVGVKKIRQGLHAFHGDADSYRIISKTFEEHEKCKLKTIRMHPTLLTAIAVTKGSPLGEHMKRGVRWLKESGLSDREYKFWVIQFPKCQGRAESFTSVRIQDFYPALLVLVYGAVISVGLLLLEKMYSHLRNLKSQRLDDKKY